MQKEWQRNSQIMKPLFHVLVIFQSASPLIFPAHWSSFKPPKEKEQGGSHTTKLTTLPVPPSLGEFRSIIMSLPQMWEPQGITKEAKTMLGQSRGFIPKSQIAFPKLGPDFIKWLILTRKDTQEVFQDVFKANKTTQPNLWRAQSVCRKVYEGSCMSAHV